MLNQLLKFTLFTSIWLWLKPRWRGLLAIIVFVLLVNILHREYLDYVNLSQDKSLLVWSFVIKWLLIIAAVVAYFMLFLMAGKSKTPGAGARSKARQGAAQAQMHVDDGFDFLRDKPKLENRAENLLKNIKT